MKDRVPAVPPLPATPSQTIGPFFRVCVAADAGHGRVLRDRTPRITLAIRVLDGTGAPVDDAMVELWQADGMGGYAFGRLGTDDAGRCEFETVQPPAPASGAPHVNVCVFARGLLRHLLTRIYFSGDERLAQDSLLALVPEHRRATLVAQPDATSPGRWIFDIHLQGDNETVFFDA